MPLDNTGAATSLPPLPYSQEAEEAVVGALLMADEYHDVLPGGLIPEHFYVEALREVFAWAAAEIADGRRADTVTAVAAFAGRPRLFEHVGGVNGYLASVAASASGMVGRHADLIIELAQRRRAIVAAHDLMAAALEDDRHTWAISLDEHQQVMDAVQAGAAGLPVADLGGAVERALRQAEALQKRGGGLAGISSGLSDLDAMLGGIGPGQLVVVAGGTGAGKTALGWYMANAAARAGERTLYVSLEMSAEELALRATAAVTRIPYSQLRRGLLSEDDWDRVVRARSGLSGRPLSIVTGSCTPGRVRALARSQRRRTGLGLIVIDYLQQLDADTVTRSLYERVTQVSRALKLLAVDLQVPVIALSQLNREAGKRGATARPQLSDLRESGAIEQDADVVLLLHREEVALRRTMREHAPDTVEHQQAQARLVQVANLMEIIVAKCRGGATGAAEVWCDVAINLFGARKSEAPQQREFL